MNGQNEQAKTAAPDKANHTPGPWMKYGGGKRRWAVRNGGGSVCQMTRRDEENANARLIAAAPDLLRALERLVYFRKCDDTPNSDLWKDAEAVIAKATGGAA